MTNEHKTILPALPVSSTRVINDLARQHGMAVNSGGEGGGQNYFQFTVPELHSFSHAMIAALAARPEPAGAPWDYKLMGLPNEDVAEMWRASGHSGVVPFSFANLIQERMQAVQAEPAGAEVESIDNTAFMGRAIAAAVEAMDVGPGGEWKGFISHIGAHDAAQVAKACSVPNAYAECCGTPNFCSSVRRCTAKDAAPQAQQPVASGFSDTPSNGGMDPRNAADVAPAAPAQDLVEAIEALHCLNPFADDNCRLYNAGFLAARSKAAALVAAHLKSTP